MARHSDAEQTTLDDDLRMLTETLEEVLQYTGDRADQAYIDIKSHAEQALSEVKARWANTGESYYARAKEAVHRTDDYVRDKPWHSLGIGATVGLVLGLLLARNKPRSRAAQAASFFLQTVLFISLFPRWLSLIPPILPAGRRRSAFISLVFVWTD